MDIEIKKTSQNLEKIIKDNNIDLTKVLSGEGSRRGMIEKKVIIQNKHASEIIFINTFGPAVVEKGIEIHPSMSFEFKNGDLSDVNLISKNVNKKVGLIIL